MRTTQLTPSSSEHYSPYYPSTQPQVPGPSVVTTRLATLTWGASRDHSYCFPTPISSLSVGHGNERVLKRAILHRTLEVVMHGARLGEEAANCC